MLEINCDRISLDEVAVNDIPTYRPLHVRNTTESPLSVAVSASSSLLRFQLRNENYEAIQQVGLRDFLSVYNEAFDLVGVITSFQLAPREEKEIVVAFRADPTAFSHLATGAHAAPFTGTVQFTASGTRSTATSPLLKKETENAFASGSGVHGEDSTITEKGTVPQQTESFAIPFVANVYVSLLKLSSSEIQVTMAPNKTQVADFVVTNTSCQPVLFLIRDQAMPLKGLDVALYEADKFEDPKLGHRILLDSYASMTFSLMLRSSGANPSAQARYHTVLQCDNLRDNRNTTFLYVSVNVGTETLGDLLAFPETSIDFGEVYRGTKAFAQIRIQNIDGREDAIVRLGDTDRRKHDGKFSLVKGDVAVDELTVPAQKGNPFTTITLMYQPSYDGDSREAAKKKFEVELLVQSSNRASSQRAVIRCAATLYTSNIVVSQSSVNFGDCQVGQSKRYTLQIENHSPLQGKVVVQLRSKIIQIEGVSRTSKTTGRELREEFTIAPSVSLPLTLKITPQRVNPMYRKQLTIINASNPAEDRQVINIEANNMAPLDTKLHDELYSWRCDLGGNSNNNSSTDAVGLHRGASTLWAISNIPLLVPYSVQSRVDREVVLHLRSSSPEIEVFYSADPVMWERLAAITGEFRRICLYGGGEEPSYLTNESAEQLFKAREELLGLLSETSRNITNRIVLGPNAVAKVYALIIRTASPTEPLSKEDGISIAVEGIEAPRFVRLSYRLCGSTFELNGQKTKNFGEVNIGVKKTTKLPIVNRCNSFLFLHLTKSRSVTAEHIRMEHSEKQSIFLTIRPYASREIELTLYPGIKGVFQEKIRVTNILNIQNSITVTLKAVVTKADTFEISPDSWTFEMMVPPSASAASLMAPSASPSIGMHATDDVAASGAAAAGFTSNVRVGAKFTVANTSNSRRQILARVELSNSNAATGVTTSHPYLAFPGVKVAVQLDMTLTGASSGSTRKLEEQIEKLEQKLKIYVRKKKTEKADGARRKIEAYKLALRGEEVDLTALESAQSGGQSNTDYELSESEDEGGASALQALKSKTQQSDIAQLLRREGVALPSMGAGESVMITLFLVCKRVLEEAIPITQSQTMNILFYEARDQEANRIIPIDMILMRTPGDTLPHPLPVAMDATAAAKLLSVTPSAVKAVDAQGQPIGDGGHADGASNPLTAPTGKASSSSLSGAVAGTRAQPVRPPPSIHLTATGVSTSGRGGRFRSTFMGHPLLVLRNCIVNDQTEFSFLVEADDDTTIVVLEPRRCGGSVPEVLDARFKLFPRNGHVRHQEPLRIVVECTARSVGPQKYFIPVKNIRNAADVHYLTVEMNPTEEIDMLTTEPKELFFRDVLTPCAPSQLESRVILIRSRFPFPHALVVRTNKPSQLALFEDALCTVPLLHPIRRIFAKETVRVYVQLRPGARYVDPCARSIHAGVLVEALAANAAVSSTAFCIVGKAVLRAVACVGSGLVEVPLRVLELGCVQSTQHYVKTQFTLRNTSHSFTLRIALVPSSPLVEVVEETTIGEEITLAPLQEHAIPLVLHLPAPGRAQEYIDVVNRSCAQEIVRVTLTALRLNEGITQVEPALNTPLSFPMAAVVRGESGKELYLHQPVSCSIRMANYHSNREVILATTATTATMRELPLRFHTADEEAQVRAEFEEEQRKAGSAEQQEGCAAATTLTTGGATSTRSGTTAPTSTPTSSHLPLTTYVNGRVELQANRAQVVMWTLTDLPVLTAEEVEAVLQHQLVTLTTTLQVCVTYTAHSAKTPAAAGVWQPHATPRSHSHNRNRGPAVGQCVLLVPVTLSFSMSEGRAEPAVVNLGLVAKPPTPPASPASVAAESSSDEDDSAEGEDPAAVPGANVNHRASHNNEEAVFAARVRRRRRVRVAQLRRPGNHQQFSSYSAKSGLQQASSQNMVVSFRLVNLSSVMPLPLKVECPPVIRFSQTRLTLPPGASISVEAMLNLKLITTQGSFRYEAFFVNEWNPENDMAVCITGQHYWKVFKILRTDTEEEVREAVTLAPLHVEPSLVAPLSELKLAFTATEPDVEFDLHVQPNPQLDGLLELLLLHYDATSSAKHLSFRSDAPVAPTTAASATTATGAATTSTALPPAATSVAGATGGGASVASLTSPNIVAASGPVGAVGATSQSGSGTPLLVGDDVASTGTVAVAGGSAGQSLSTQLNIANAMAANAAASTASSATVAAAVAGAAAPANPSGSAKPRKAGAGALPGGASGTTGAASVATTRSQRLRLRCMLRSGDLASLVSMFYGVRRSRTNAAAGANVGSSIGDTAGSAGTTTMATTQEATGSSAAVTWTYDRIAELERRTAALVSNNVWLGTVWVANPFTEDEELQVYGTLSPFRTFSAPSKISLRPSRIVVEAPNGTPQTDGAAGSNRSLQVGYVGEITITNDFDVYIADLSVVVVVHDRLGVPLEIDLRGGQRVVAASVGSGSGGGAGGTTASLAETARSDTSAIELGYAGATTLAATAPTSLSTPAPTPAVATSFVAASRSGGAPPVSQPHCVQLGPHETVVLTVAVRSADARAPSAGSLVAGTSTSTPHLSLSSLEQFVSVVIVDDNIPFSYHVSRVNVVTPADGVEALPTVTLSASPSLLQSSAAPPICSAAPQQPQQQQSTSPSKSPELTAAASAAVVADTTEGEKNPRSTTPTSTEAVTHPPLSEESFSATSGVATTIRAALEEGSDRAISLASRRSSTHTSHGVADDGAAPLPSAAMRDLNAVETSSAEAADAASDADGGYGGGGDGLTVQAQGGRSDGAAEGPSNTATRSATPATSVATTGMPPTGPDATTPRHWVLSLRNCDSVPGCGAAYTSNFSVARGDTYDPSIVIKNHLPNTAVRYNVQVVSQSPQVWLLLTSTAGVLGGGEMHPLRLQVLSSEVGSFVGYVAITNTHDTREVVYLRMNAEVFVPGTAEGLFDVIAMNGGQRLATTSAVHDVDMGALYGPGTSRSLIALEIVNKGNVALEFPVSVVHPMRQELRPIPQSVWYGSAVTTLGHRQRHANAAVAALSSAPTANTPRQHPAHGDTSADTPNSLPTSSSALTSTTAFSTAAAGTNASGVGAATENASLLHAQSPQRSIRPHNHHHRGHHHHGMPRVGSTATANAAATAAAINASSTTPFEGKLVVCHIHSVPLRTGQKYFVVDPRSPLRLAFLLTCNALHDIPDGYGVFGEADVVFKCKQARDAQFTFNVKFEAFKPTFSVALEYDMDAVSTVATMTTTASATGEVSEYTVPGMTSPAGPSQSSSFVPSASRSVRAPNVAAPSSRYAETEVAVTNLSRTNAQVFVLFSQSEVLMLSPASTSSSVRNALPGSELLPPMSSATASEDVGASAAVLLSTPAVEVTVAPQSVGVFIVRLDRLRAEALLNFDKDESKLARPALCEHAYLYNKGNPRERVQLLFRQHAVSVQRPGKLDTALITAGPVSPTRADAKPVRGSSTQHFSERHILSFAQRFSAMLTSLAERLPFVARVDDASEGVGGVNVGGGDQSAAISGTKIALSDLVAGGGAGTGLGAALRASAGNTAGITASTPGRSHDRRTGHHGRAALDDGGAVGSVHRVAALHGSRLDSTDDSTSDDTTATTSSSSTSSSDDEADDSQQGAADDGDHTLNSTFTEDSNGALGRAVREAGEEINTRDVGAEGPVHRAGTLNSAKATQSSTDSGEADRRQRQQTPSALTPQARQRNGESGAETPAFSPASPASLSTAGTGSARGSVGSRGTNGGEATWGDALYTLHDLLVELTWLCDELLFYAILLRNSRHVEACGAFLVSAVSQHPVMMAWRRRRGSVSRTREYDIFGRFLDTIDGLPRTSNSTS